MKSKYMKHEEDDSNISCFGNFFENLKNLFKSIFGSNDEDKKPDHHPHAGDEDGAIGFAGLAAMVRAKAEAEDHAKGEMLVAGEAFLGKLFGIGGDAVDAGHHHN